MADEVLYNVRKGVALLTVNNPPVNALNRAVRAALLAAVEAAIADEAVGALVIQAQGRTFPSGAEMRDFDNPGETPTLAALCNRIEAAPKPVIAAIHGTALGGGLELALACHYRLMQTEARLGLPDVALGLVPAAGGSQRLSRIVGAFVALDMLISSRSIQGETALRLGLVDRVVQENLGRAAFGAARNLIGAGTGPRPTRERTEGFADPAAYLEVVAARREKVAGERRIAVHRAVDLVEAALLLPFEAGLEMERAHFGDLVNSDQARGLRHAFLAERRSARLPQDGNRSPRPVRHVGVVGGGRLGAGIVRACLAAGLAVTLVEIDAAALDAARGRIDAGLARDAERGRISAAAREAQLAALQGAVDPAALGAAQLVIEAVGEDAAARRAVFAAAAAATAPGVILASADLAPDLAALAAASGRPDDVMGLRFFVPAHRVRLLEVVCPPGASPDLAATGVAFARALNKLPVLPAPGGASIALPVFAAMFGVAAEALVAGLPAAEVDAAMRAEGFPMGPLQLADLAGIDRLAAQGWPGAAGALPAAMTAAGLTGQRAGRGFYRYGSDVPADTPEPALAEVLSALHAGSPGPSAQPGLAERAMFAMANAGARLLVDGVARRPSDIDAAAIAGFGFPRWHGGPMEMADHLGPLAVRNRLRALAETGEAALYAPAPLFDVLIKNGSRFDLLNRDSPPRRTGPTL